MLNKIFIKIAILPQTKNSVRKVALFYVRKVALFYILENLINV